MNRTLLTILAAAILSAAAATPAFAASICHGGFASAAAIRQAAAALPASRAVPRDVGTRLRRGVRTAPVPKRLASVLPQYVGYRAVRTHDQVAIVDPRSRRVVYLLPLNLNSHMRCPMS